MINDLLQMDAFARRFGCALNPKLRSAMEADQRWPSKAAAPVPDAVPEVLPDNAVRFPDPARAEGQKRA
ncbi:hypothetical protein [Tateyamaria sp. syn59]|uniref:hypothetical protein n=1 Tax=Tateyamaria sp. syn59 TaxID=2576942 RepID=UPI0011BF3E14|nr:hypothetical protein [Tateyamaria sp. syn59]